MSTRAMALAGGLLIGLQVPSAAAQSLVVPRAREPKGTAPKGTLERNNQPMMISGIVLTTLGVIAVGVGLGLLTHRRIACDDKAVVAVKGVPLKYADAYDAAYNHCVRGSASIQGGIGALVGGGLFAAVGIPFTIAGDWKVRVAAPRAPGVALRVGPRGVVLGWQF